MWTRAVSINQSYGINTLATETHGYVCRAETRHVLLLGFPNNSTVVEYAPSGADGFLLLLGSVVGVQIVGLVGTAPVAVVIVLLCRRPSDEQDGEQRQNLHEQE
jgi:hypothetical protein